MNKKDCFAYCEKKGKPTCHALTDLNCENCRFYKNRKEIKKNSFYAFSYDDELEHHKEVKRKNIKEDAILWK